jgi:nicotinamidase-related amidase
MDHHIAPDRTRCVLLTIDVQRDFAEPGASAEIPGTAACVPRMRAVLDEFRRRQKPVVHVVRLYLADGSNADLSRRTRIGGGCAIVAPGTPGADLVDALQPQPHARQDAAVLLKGQLQQISSREWLMFKPRWGAFFQTSLEQHLRELGISTIVILGCNFPNCPRATIYEASERDLKIVLVADATSRVHDVGVEEMRDIGVVVQTAAQCIAWLDE